MHSNDDKTSRPGQGQIFEAEAEAEAKIPRGHFGLEGNITGKRGLISRINNVILPLLVDPKILRKTAI